MNENKTSELLAQLEAGYSIPALSPVALKLVEVAMEEAVSAKDLAELVERDPPLAVRLLKLANSAFFRRTRPVTSIQQAVVQVGFQRLRIMALSISLKDTFPLGKVGPLDYEEFWRVSLYRALIAKSLAESQEGCNPDEAFVAAFIQEIGLLIFFDLFMKGNVDRGPLQIDPLESLIRWEREEYGVDHRQVGQAALTYWRFPEPIVDCQQAYSRGLEDHEIHPLIRVCELSRALSSMLRQPAEGFHAPYQEAEERLRIKPQVVNDILVTTLEQIEEIAENLSVEINKEKDLLQIMDKANSALATISETLSKEERNLSPVSLPALESLDNRQDSTKQTLEAVAHEIRNPLLVVAGFARRLATSVEPDSAGGKYIEIILEEALRIEKTLTKMTETDRTNES
jgi:HD-like signal output (HDOD) protein